MRSRSKLDRDGQPLLHGTKWNGEEGVVIKAISRGPNEKVILSNPRRAIPRRVLSSHGIVDTDLSINGSEVSVVSNKPEGEPITIIVEY